MSDKNKELVKQVDASFGENNIEGFLGLCAENVEWTMAGEATKTGKDSIREWMNSMGGDMTPPVIESRNMIAEGDRVASYGTMTMTGGDGETGEYDYCDIYRFDDGKIAELNSYVIKSKKD